MKILKYKNEFGSIHGLTSDQIKDAIQIAWAIWSDVSNVQFEEVSNRQDFTLKTDTLYIGRSGSDYNHARGRRSGNNLLLHSGFIPKHQGPVDYDFNWTPFANKEAAGKILAHELGHWLGLRHNSDTTCLMNQNNTATKLCPSELAFAKREFGELEGPPPQPESKFLPNGYLRPGTWVDNVNMPDIANGSFVLDGQRHFLKGQRLVGVKFQVFIHDDGDEDCCAASVKP